MHITKQIEDGYLGSGKYLNNAIKKYGKQNFIRQILFQCKTLQQLQDKERCIITEEIVKDPLSYNLSLGGHGSWHYVNSNGFNCKQEAKIKIKQNHYDCSGSNNSQYGTKWYCNNATGINLKIKPGDIIPDGYKRGMIKPKMSDQTKLKLSIAKKGKKLSDQVRKKMSGKVPWNKGKKTAITPLVGKICINNKQNNKFIYSQELSKYELLGWHKGMCNNHNWKNPDTVRAKIKKSLKK